MRCTFLLPRVLNIFILATRFTDPAAADFQCFSFYLTYFMYQSNNTQNIVAFLGLIVNFFTENLNRAWCGTILSKAEQRDQKHIIG